ncbi:hypothetical protein JYU34_000667 [Plutella xylostella]|uniref:Uncharacterized protein n=1 Tax=Plutella xylostella TaxID=51655 RepID=A0ABQ7R889_PLUXY|nr:hypothetical protein JYU34_000667 [Plutella xylostella]
MKTLGRAQEKQGVISTLAMSPSGIFLKDLDTIHITFKKCKPFMSPMRLTGWRSVNGFYKTAIETFYLQMKQCSAESAYTMFIMNIGGLSGTPMQSNNMRIKCALA